jgi:hypothetical protein
VSFIFSQPLTKKDFSIAPSCQSERVIGFEDSFEKLYQLFGKPKEIVVGRNTTDSKWDDIVHKYPGLMVSGYREWKKIYYIYVFEAGYKTSRGISVGDPKQMVLKAYGKPDYEGKFIQYYLKVGDAGGSWVLSFDLINGIVTEITMNLSD